MAALIVRVAVYCLSDVCLAGLWCCTRVGEAVEIVVRATEAPGVRQRGALLSPLLEGKLCVERPLHKSALVAICPWWSTVSDLEKVLSKYLWNTINNNKS